MTTPIDIDRDEVWGAVLAQFGGEFDTLSLARKIECFDRVNRRRSLHEHETDILCELIEKERSRRFGKARRKGESVSVQSTKQPPRDETHATLRRAIAAMGGHKAMADRLGLSQAAVWRWDSQFGRCPRHQAERIAEITGIPAHELRPDAD